LPDRPRITPEEWTTHVERFEEAEADPQRAIAAELPAPKPNLLTTVVAPSAFLVVWVVMGSIVTAGFSRGPGTPMVFFPLLIMIGGVVGLGWMIRTGVVKARSPVLRAVAVVVDKRTSISTRGSGDDRSTTTSYFATLQFKDGTRAELPTTDGLAGFVTDGDIGLAVVRGGDLVDFHRFKI
jgi:hypothetical protein